ncbi:MAG TPA: hypothetical protein VGE35_02090 [Candidatus Paceibacterota bacterium]
MTKLILKVLLGWFFVASFLGGFGYFIQKPARDIGKITTVSEVIWLPKSYVHANKLPDGSYGAIDSVSFNSMTMSVAFDEAFKVRASLSEQTVVTVTSEGVHYVATYGGIEYRAFWSPLPGSPAAHKRLGARILTDHNVIWKVQDCHSLALTIIFICIMAALIVVPFKGIKAGMRSLWKDTQKLFPKAPGLAAC